MKEINLEEVLIKHEVYEEGVRGEYSRHTVLEFAKDLAQKVLELAAEETEICLIKYDEEGNTHKIGNLGQEITTEREYEYITTDKDSILNCINNIK